MKLKFRNFPIGKIILCMDLTIAVITGVVYRDFNNTLYSVIAMVVSSMALDRVVYGMDYSKVALIITEKYEAIATAIDSQLDRGVTLLKGQGYYKRQDKMVLLSAREAQAARGAEGAGHGHRPGRLHHPAGCPSGAGRRLQALRPK